MGILIDGRKATFKIGSVTYEDIVSFEMTDEAKNQISFTDIRLNRVKKFTLSVTCFIDMATGGLWRAAYDADDADLDIVWALFGNAVADEDQPHILLNNAHVDGKPGLSAEANVEDKPVVTINFLVDDYDLDEGA